MKTKFLVFGNGLLGSTFKWAVSDTVVLSKAQCDITDKEAVRSALAYYSPRTVINAAGIVPRNTEASIEQTFKVNSFAPHYIADLCKRKHEFIHISTDCVFKGDRGHYTEKDKLNATDTYGMSKIFGEPTNALIIRTSFVGLPDPKQRGLFAWASSQEEITGYDRVFWNGLTTFEVVNKICEYAGQGIKGVRHVYGYTLSKYALLVLAKRIFEWDVNILRESDNNGKTHSCDKTLSSVYATGFVTKPLSQQLREMRDVSIRPS